MRRDRLTIGVATLLAGLCAAPTCRADDPQAVDIAARMGTVVDDLSRKQTGQPVQAEQKGVVEDLDALIASLERQCQACKGGIKKNKPRKGMDDSMIRSGTGGAGDLTAADDGGKDWGKLTPRERDRILQSMNEGFPPEYRTVLERYYRRLADEKSAKSGAKAPAEATAPAADSAKP